MSEIDHETFRTLLPWYVNQTLPGAERRALDRHLEACPHCRRELEECVRLSRAVEGEATPVPTAHPAQLARLLDRIDRGELDANEADTGRPRARSAARSGIWLRRTPVPVRWLVAAQAAAILVLVSLLGVAAPPRPPEPEFRTLSRDAAPPSAARIRIVFSPDASEVEIRRLLLGIRAQIVGGPSPFGAYAIALERLAVAESDESVLELLRADPRVVLAEPVVGGDAPAR